jgi:poly(A) polymerase
VAHIDGRVIAHGGTPQQARLAARLNRHKETPEISFMPPAPPLRFSPLIDRILPILGETEVYLTGGAVRDALMGRESHDFDFAVRSHAIDVARRVARLLEADFYVLDKDFDAARVILRPVAGPRDILDFAAFRGEDLDADLTGRDFTINAIAFDPRNGTLLDPLGGGSDLRAKLIRACSESAIRDDPVRILRAVRQAAALGFKIEIKTRTAMREGSSLLPNVSPERQRDELFRILDGPGPEAALKALDMLGTIPYFLPELTRMKGVAQSPPHVYDVWEHTLAVIRHLGGIFEAMGPNSESARNREVFTGLLSVRLGRYRRQFQDHFSRRITPDRSQRSLLFFAALYHDVAKPVTRSVDAEGRIRFFGHEVEAAVVAADRAGKYNLSNDETSRVQAIVANHMRFNLYVERMQSEKEAPTRRAVYRFFRNAGEAGLDLVTLGLADQWGVREHTLDQGSWEAAVEVARILLENYLEKPQESVEPPRLLDGNDIMREYDIQPGPAVGEVLEAIREAQATGEVTDRKTAIAFGRKRLEGRKS